ncbi:hypothetical protein DSM112329_02899 [Paraconexibacter sp. AEG42_29]|uniref:Uncharacterized protein n=1 Tax=Paraconexibacter sp. AEG42_29 TaxID=2997339 RepID=A0AAU7AWL1_9ACTN
MPVAGFDGLAKAQPDPLAWKRRERDTGWEVRPKAGNECGCDEVF